MKMFVTRIALMTAMAVAPLFTAGAAYAQRYHEAPQSYGAADQSGVRHYRSTDDQRTIDEITGNDWNAGK